MPSAFSAGPLGKVFIGATELPAFKYEITSTSNAQDVSNTRDGRKRIASLQDAKGTFSLHWDASATPTDNPPNIIQGAILTIKTYVTASRFFTCSIIIASVKVTSEVEKTIDFDGEWEMESGVLTYP